MTYFVLFVETLFPLTYSLVNTAGLSNRVCSLYPLCVSSFLNFKAGTCSTDFYIWYSVIVSLTIIPFF